MAIVDRDTATGELSQDLVLPAVSRAIRPRAALRGWGSTGNRRGPSPDGLNVYVAAYFANALTSFDRNPLSGNLTQKPGAAGCISEDGSGGDCEDGSGLDGVHGVTVSPDGKNVYATAKFSNVLSIFDRGAGGALTRKPAPAGCVSETGADGCADGTGIGGAHLPQVSPDGANVYMTAYDAKAIAIFDRFVAPPTAPGGAPRATCAAGATL